MFWRVAAFSVLIVMIFGCAPARTGADFAALSRKIGPPKVGQARIVVFRELAYGGLFDQGWDVKLDGQTMRDLKTGTYVYADRPAGRHELSSSMAMFPGVTQRAVNVTQVRPTISSRDSVKELGHSIQLPRSVDLAGSSLLPS